MRSMTYVRSHGNTLGTIGILEGMGGCQVLFTLALVYRIDMA